MSTARSHEAADQVDIQWRLDRVEVASALTPAGASRCHREGSPMTHREEDPSAH